MAKDGKKLELDSTSNIFLPNSILKHNQQSTDSTDSTDSTHSITHHDNDKQTSISETFDLDQLTLFFSTRVSILCFNNFVRHEQLQEA